MIRSQAPRFSVTAALAIGLFGLLGLFASAAYAQTPSVDPYASDTRIVIDARLNEKPARLLFDTGASSTALFASQASRLGIKSESIQTANIAGHEVSMGMTPSLNVSLLGKNAQTRLPILPFPPAAECDGILSWRILGDAPYFIDAASRRVRPLRELPRSAWQRWPLDMESSQLFFQVKQDGKSLGRVFVDTGASIGLRLTPQLWDEWKKHNPKAGITLTTYRYAVGEPMVHELSWAAEYRLGNLLLRDVDIGPIPEAKDGKAIAADGKEFIATIGIGALRHLRMIVSRSTGEILTQSISPFPRHNRLGAVFLQRTGPGEATPSYTAQVLERSPAYRAGLRNGDVLLSINDVDFSAKSTAHPSTLEGLLMQPAGTRLQLQVKRGHSIHEFKVVLEELLP